SSTLRCATDSRRTRSRAASCASAWPTCRCCRAASPTCRASWSASMPSERTTVPALVARWSAGEPDTRFLVTETAHLTFAQLDDGSARVAELLARRGVGKGTRVGLLLPNGIEWAVLACGILRAGAVLVPLSTLLRPAELEAQLRIAAVEALVL